MTHGTLQRPVKQYLVDVDGTSTRLLEVSGPGPNAVFLHGVGARADRWRRALPLFGDAGYHCYAADFPGHGLAAKPADFDYSVPGYSTYVRALMDRLEIETAVLVGTSLGGHVAGAIACADPDRVEALVLIGPMGLLEVDDAVLEALAVNIMDRSPEGIAAKLNRLLVDTSLVTDDWIDEEVRINNSAGADDAFAALAQYFRTRINTDVIGTRLASLSDTLRMLLVWGADDVMVPAGLAEPALQLLGGDAQLVMLSAAGHAPYFEQAEAFASEVLGFLNR